MLQLYTSYIYYAVSDSFVLGQTIAGEVISSKASYMEYMQKMPIK
jgi:hypothetical protein